jgi:uncharacterized protein (TIGR00255 family)
MISMSGFGQASRSAAGYSLSVLIRSVNARFLDVRVVGPDELAGLQALVEARVKERIPRGKVDVRLRLTRTAEATVPATDPARVRAVVHWLEGLAGAAGRDWPVQLEHVLQVKDALLASPPPDEALDEATALAAVDEALEHHREMAEREGARTEAHVRRCVAGLGTEVDKAAALLAALQPKRREALLARIRDAVGGALDPARLEQEVALLVERADVGEELTRLRSHLAELQRLLAEPKAAPKGKKLDYLCVEIHRELNTCASKNAAPEVTAPLIEARLWNEQIREQSANVY